MKEKQNYFTRRSFLKSGVLLTAGISAGRMYPFNATVTNRRQISSDEDALYAAFSNPPATAKPFVRWWWNGDKLTSAEIVRELDVMREAGIGGVEINPIAFPGGDDLGIPSMPWLSDEWIGMVKVALQAAEERGIICDIIVGSGWPFGAEILEGDDRSQLITIASQKIQGPGKVKIDLAKIKESAKPRIGSPWKGMDIDIYELCIAPVKMDKVVKPKWLKIDTGRSEIEIDAPAGEHILYTLVKVTGFQAVINGAPGAAGPVLNHYSKSATEKFLNRMSDKLFPQLSGLKGFRAMFCDSMELEGANWCPDYLEEFQRRRGYDLKPYLPYVLYKVGHMGHIDRTGDITQLSGEAQEEVSRVRYDFFTTCMQIITDRFLITYTQWCNRHGFKSRMQPYGNEFHPLEASLNIDIPECETWMWRNTVNDRSIRDFVNSPGYTNINKFVASATALAGKKIVSCEESTNTDLVFNMTLEQLKVNGDQSNLSGVNHSILHGFNYSPPETPFPGWIRYGMFLNDRNTWWPYFRQWAAYKTRLSVILQESTPFADLALLHPLADMWTIHGPQRDPFPGLHYPAYQYKVWEGIHKNGNSCDYTSENIIRQSSVENGCLTYGKRAYGTLILMEVESMEPATARMIAKFVAGGGKLIFIAKEPYKSPGLKNFKSRDKEVAAAFSALKKAYPQRIFTVEAPEGKGENIVEWFGKVQRQCGIKPYMQIDNPTKAVSQIRTQAAGRDVFFLSNASSDEAYKLKVAFPDSKGKPWRWDAETGERYPLTTLADGRLEIDLQPSESQLIVFDTNIFPVTLQARLPEPAETAGLELHDWTLRLEHIDGSEKTISIPAPFDLASDNATVAFAGRLYYEKQLPAYVADYNWLDLGRVHGVSEVYIDGVKIGNRWYGRHRYRLPRDSGGKQLQIKVTTTVGNYLKSSPKNEIGQRWTRGQKFAPVGIAGPIKVK